MIMVTVRRWCGWSPTSRARSSASRTRRCPSWHGSIAPVLIGCSSNRITRRWLTPCRSSLTDCCRSSCPALPGTVSRPPEFHRAVLDRRKIKIIYSRAWYPGVTERVIEPYAMVRTRRGWEVDAGPVDDHGRLRTYLLTGVQSFSVLDETFERPADVDALLRAQRGRRRSRSSSRTTRAGPSTSMPRLLRCRRGRDQRPTAGPAARARTSAGRPDPARRRAGRKSGRAGRAGRRGPGAGPGGCSITTVRSRAEGSAAAPQPWSGGSVRRAPYRVFIGSDLTRIPRSSGDPQHVLDPGQAQPRRAPMARTVAHQARRPA